jgi:predicted metal-binding membrane protein
VGSLETSVEMLARRDRTVVLGGLFALLSLSWAYTVLMVLDMPGAGAHEAMSMMASRHWSGVEALFTFLMWAIMMVAMMTPTTALMLFAFMRLNRMRSPEKSSSKATFAFLLGYLTLWTGFSLVATIAQWGLHETALLSLLMKSESAWLSGSLLLVAGVYQFTPLKHACLAKCRAPMGFLMTEWRDGIRGKFVMGVCHGAYCIGCCWLLMALLFVGGVMSLLWIAALTIVILAEKLLPSGRFVSAALGLIAVGWGTWLLANA